MNQFLLSSWCHHAVLLSLTVMYTYCHPAKEIQQGMVVKMQTNEYLASGPHYQTFMLCCSIGIIVH